MEDFFVVVASNSSLELFSQNTLSCFKVQLCQHIPPDSGTWEVGLSEIHFPFNWNNIKNGYVLYKTSYEGTKVTRLDLPAGYYPSIKSILTTIEKLLRDFDKRSKRSVEISYDKISDTVTLEVKAAQVEISLSNELSNILGFSTGQFFTLGMHTAPYHTDINEGFHSLYVYGSCVENRLVSDSMVPLLRVVPLHNNVKRGNNYIPFHNIEYIPALKTRTNVLEINIRRDDESFVPFESSKVVVTLHFRKRQ